MKIVPSNPLQRFFSESVNSSMTEGEELRLGLISIVGRRWVCQWPQMFSFKIEFRTFFENSTYGKIMYRSNESIYCVCFFFLMLLLGGSGVHPWMCSHISIRNWKLYIVKTHKLKYIIYCDTIWIPTIQPQLKQLIQYFSLSVLSCMTYRWYTL